MEILKKFKLILNKPKTIVIAGNDREAIKEKISRLLGPSFKIEKEILFVGNIEKISLSDKNYLIFNFDTNRVPRIKEDYSVKILSFGFKEGADFQITDVKINGETNFKINYQGNIVPVWLKGALGQQELYSVLSAIAVGTVFGLNLVEISQALKDN